MVRLPEVQKFLGNKNCKSRLQPVPVCRSGFFIAAGLPLRMTKLSVNLNKFATLRNARGGNNPDIVKAAIDAQRFFFFFITVHPRPDERHIRYEDVRQLKKVSRTEFKIEGN